MADPLEEIRALTRFDEPARARVREAERGRKAERGRLTEQGRQAAQQAAVERIGLWPLLAMLAAICLLWTTPVVYPLRLLVVFFHELSHALMALLTGGSVHHIELSANEGGLAFNTGGNAFLITGAGYLGSLLWGGTLLALTTRLRNTRPLTAALGALLILVCLAWVRPLLSFGVPFCLLAGAGLIAVGLRVNNQLNSLLLRLIGLTSILYVPLDIFEDTVLYSGQVSDARILAAMTLIPTAVWGVLWCGLSVVMAWWFLREAVRRA